MPSGYKRLNQASPRSFLFYVVANVGPGGSSRPLAVAYRQGNDFDFRYFPRVEYLANDILSVLTILSSPTNRGALEAECVQAKNWYLEHQRQENADPEEGQRPPALPDTPQPLWTGYPQRMENWKVVMQPELPPRSDNTSPIEFPVTSNYLVEGLLRGNKTTRKGDVQLQPLTLPFYGNCLEYGMMVIDISHLSRITYGIVAFPVRYMAFVEYWHDRGGWDPCDDEPPEQEPDIVHVDDRPRVPLSILGYLRRHFPTFRTFTENAKVLELEERFPHLVDTRALDYIWPIDKETQRSDLVESSREEEELPASVPQKCSIL
ncbi:hypothetical protein DM02DRAFT_633684 [Periconia macrospinosa]|uniref:Uncharacterized protein n=1 Tax=Periconia macrospinosa TaxID=97972 RepID=A0A2V1DA98_9PLEO|nr:hypothetical protein DM02DRAFT_633684 [Periconia macrospinosa]